MLIFLNCGTCIFLDKNYVRLNENTRKLYKISIQKNQSFKNIGTLKTCKWTLYVNGLGTRPLAHFKNDSAYLHVFLIT